VFDYGIAWVGIKDNRIVHTGYVYSNPDKYMLIPKDIDMDSIGIIAYKSVMEYTDSLAGFSDPSMVIAVMELG
jgi:hypothetical protein